VVASICALGNNTATFEISNSNAYIITYPYDLSGVQTRMNNLQATTMAYLQIDPNNSPNPYLRDNHAGINL